MKMTASVAPSKMPRIHAPVERRGGGGSGTAEAAQEKLVQAKVLMATANWMRPAREPFAIEVAA